MKDYFSGMEVPGHTFRNDNKLGNVTISRRCLQNNQKTCVSGKHFWHSGKLQAMKLDLKMNLGQTMSKRLNLL